MAEKATKMLIKADWNCPRCAEKIRKIFAEYPQIWDPKYVEKKNAVSITVVSGCPEEIRRDIKLKGGKFVESVEILPDEKPKKPKKVCTEQKKETAKTPAHAPVKATKPAPTKPLKQVVVLPQPPKELKVTKQAPTKPLKQVVVLPPPKELKATKPAPTKHPKQVVVLPPPKEPKTTKRTPTEPPKQVVVLAPMKVEIKVELKGCKIYNQKF